ncbi:MAG: peptidoglycan D,D-transpeptidase FtsI family protein [Alphaproteobacteria bacterium]
MENKWGSFSLGEDLTDHLKRKKSVQKNENTHIFKSRLRWLNRIVFLTFFIIVFNLFSLSAPRNISFSFFKTTHDGWKTSFVSRSDLVDRKGEMLATNLPTYHLAIRPNKIQNKEYVAKNISISIEGLSYENALKKISKSKSYVYLKKAISEKERKAILKLKIEGIELEKIDRRNYPKKNIFAHLIGFTDTDNKGLRGLENGLDSEIRKTPNTPFKIACDSRFQEIIYTALKKGIEKHQAKGGGAILMKSDTGEILSFISLPDFDPNEIGKSPQENRFNKLTSGVYEPGSIFKLFNTAIALETGLSEDKLYDVHTPLKVGRFRINDAHKREEKYTTMDQILIHSSNIGSAQIAWEIGKTNQKKYLKKFGFFEKLNTELGESARPLLPVQWAKSESATVSYGHGISVSPLQIITAVNTLINGGYYLPPRFTPVTQNSFEAHPVISEETSRKMRALMYRIVEEGTGQKVKIDGIQIGGKTGTSEKTFNGKYAHDRLLNWFVSVFPIKNPAYTLLVMIDEPKGLKENWNLKTSAWNAVPITREMIQNILPFLNIEKIRTEKANNL